ncbi:molybdopterin molybdenumtransferase MoeA, partial [Agromyces binzhouensis]
MVAHRRPRAGEVLMTRIPFDEHARFVRSLLAPLGARPTERVAVGDALGRITASPVESPIDLPPFRNAQMDGLAVRAADVAGAPVELPVVGESAAAPG